LGIGAAGGKSSASEGAMLAARLDTLRKERSERTPEIKKKEVLSSNSFQPSPQPVPSVVPAGRGKPSKRNKRRKKNKR